MDSADLLRDIARDKLGFQETSPESECKQNHWPKGQMEARNSFCDMNTSGVAAALNLAPKREPQPEQSRYVFCVMGALFKSSLFTSCMLVILSEFISFSLSFLYVLANLLDILVGFVQQWLFNTTIFQKS